MISRSTEFRLNLNTSILFLHTFQHTDCDDVQGPDDAHVSTGPPGAGEPAAGANLQLYGSLVPQPGWRVVSYLFFFWSQMGVVMLIELMFVNCSEILQWIVH